MNVLFKLCVLNADGTVFVSVLERCSFFLIEHLDEAQPTKVIDLLTKRLEEALNVYYENEKPTFKYITSRKTNDAIFVNRDADLKYLMHIYPIRKLASGSYFLELTTVHPAKHGPSVALPCKETNLPVEECCVFQCTQYGKFKRLKSLTKNKDECSTVRCYFEYLQCMMTKLEEVTSQLKGVSKKTDSRNTSLRELESSINDTKFQLKALGKTFEQDFFKQNLTFPNKESEKKDVDLEQLPLEIKPAVDIVDVSGDSNAKAGTGAQKTQMHHEEVKQQATAEPNVASTEPGALIKRRKVKKRLLLPNDNSSSVSALPVQEVKELGRKLSFGSPNGAWSVTELQHKLSNIKVEEQSSVTDDINRAQSQDAEFPFHADPVISAALESMLAMGYHDEGGVLTELLVAQDGDVARVLEILDENDQRRRKYYASDSYFLT